MDLQREQKGLNINPEDLEDVHCDKCGCQTFEPVMLFKKLSAVLSPTGQTSLIPLQLYKCTDCGHINDEFIPNNGGKKIDINGSKKQKIRQNKTP